MGPEDIKNLAGVLKENTSTTTLNLQGNKNITDKSAAILLKALQKNNTLQFVNLDGTGMTDPAKDEFQRKLRQKFEPKTPGFFARLWQRIVNAFSKSKINENPENLPEALEIENPQEVVAQEMDNAPVVAT